MHGGCNRFTVWKRSGPEYTLNAISSQYGNGVGLNIHCELMQSVHNMETEWAWIYTVNQCNQFTIWRRSGPDYRLWINAISSQYENGVGISIDCKLMQSVQSMETDWAWICTVGAIGSRCGNGVGLNIHCALMQSVHNMETECACIYTVNEISSLYENGVGLNTHREWNQFTIWKCSGPHFRL